MNITEREQTIFRDLARARITEATLLCELWLDHFGLNEEGEKLLLVAAAIFAERTHLLLSDPQFRQPTEEEEH